MVIIEFKNVSFRYDKDAQWVLRDCSFKINKNESVAIIGHNGSGKSTIAKLMIGLLFPEKGEIIVDDVHLTHESVWEIRKSIGMVFQNPDNQFVATTVQDDIAFGMENRGISRDIMLDKIDETLKIVNMEKYLLHEPHRLSGGQKQRVAIAGVLAISPKVIILDEATVMLDPLGRTEIMETISTIQRTEEISLITITHDLHEVIKVEKVIVLNQGEVWKVTSPRELMTHGTKLKTMGLDIPFTTELTQQLKELDVMLLNDALTIEEMMGELWTFHSTK